MKPYLSPGQASSQTMELIGIIAHQGTKEQGHYVTITKKGNEWISHNDAKVTPATLTQLHQTQAYIKIYRKMDHNGGIGTNGPKDSIMVVQQSTAKKFKLSHGMEHSPEESPLLPENLEILETPLTNRPTPQAPETRGEGEVGGAVELDGVPSSNKVDHRQTPLDEKGLGQFENEHTNLPQTISTFFHLSQGRIEELTSLLSKLSGTLLTMERDILMAGSRTSE